MPHKRSSGSQSTPKLAQAGFEEAQAAFVDNSPARERFNESVELLRAFNMIESPADRRDVVDLARRLAAGKRG